MLANSNLKICRILVRQNFRFHRIRSLLLILSAALVTGLYSFVFLMGNSMGTPFCSAMSTAMDPSAISYIQA